MKIKVSEATNIQLDWMVWNCTGGASAYPKTAEGPAFLKLWKGNSAKYIHPTTDWSQGGPIFSGARIGATFHPEWEVPNWGAWVTDGDDHQEVMGETELIAKARCFVRSKLGETVEVPEELT